MEVHCAPYLLEECNRVRNRKLKAGSRIVHVGNFRRASPGNVCKHAWYISYAQCNIECNYRVHCTYTVTLWVYLQCTLQVYSVPGSAVELCTPHSQFTGNCTCNVQSSCPEHISVHFHWTMHVQGASLSSLLVYITCIFHEHCMCILHYWLHLQCTLRV